VKVTFEREGQHDPLLKKSLNHRQFFLAYNRKQAYIGDLPSFMLSCVKLILEGAMGEFAEQVKDRKIYGLHTRKFMRKDWEAIARRENTDPEDKRLAWAGIFFDDLLTYLRSEGGFSKLPFRPSALARLVIRLNTWNDCRITAQIQGKWPTPKPGETPLF
jgi:hypothetical protein